MKNYIERALHSEINEMLKYYPVVTVLGPRQSGKSTLSKKVLSNRPYVSLENPDERSLAINDPRGFLERFPQGAILDEIQRAPALLSYIQGIVDERNENGLFLLTGSHQLSLHTAITQSLAGRTAILKLLPFSMIETLTLNDNINHILLKGGYPRVCVQHMAPEKFYRDYIQTYIERDLRLMINIKDLSIFQAFLKLCAGHVGQIINVNSFSAALGLSNNTIKNWLSILEASFIIFRLPPYFENFGKRVIKSHKLYFYDTGLAAYLADIRTTQQCDRDPIKGHLFENLIILEIMKYALNHGLDTNFYFYRDSNDQEVDLLLRSGSQIISIEIKSSKTFNKIFTKTLLAFKELLQDKHLKSYLIYQGDIIQNFHDIQLCNIELLPKMMEEVFHRANSKTTVFKDDLGL